MTDPPAPAEHPLPAGAFATWLTSAVRAVVEGAEAEVPCGSCTACCRSSYFVHIESDEDETLAHIPAELLFPAPGAPEGHVLLGYDEKGRCPMLGEEGCSIYEHRPRTCRSFDCRVFAAAGLDPGEDGKRDIAVQVSRWRFEHPDPRALLDHKAVQAAAVFLRDHPACFPGGEVPSNVRDLAAVAVHVHALFVDHVAGELRSPDPAEVASALRR